MARGIGVYQFSLRSLLFLTVVIAFTLTPVAWVARERQAMLAAQRDLLVARDVALRSVIREGERRRYPAEASPAATAENRESEQLQQLRRENAELRKQVESLRLKVIRLEAEANPHLSPVR